MRYLLIMLLAALLVAGGLALGLAFAPAGVEANCHTFSQQLPDIGPDRGGPLNPLRCTPDGEGGTKCSYRW